MAYVSVTQYRGTRICETAGNHAYRVEIYRGYDQTLLMGAKPTVEAAKELVDRWLDELGGSLT